MGRASDGHRFPGEQAQDGAALAADNGGPFTHDSVDVAAGRDQLPTAGGRLPFS